MKSYDVYFEFFGRKMKTKVLAKNEYDARVKIKDRIIFHKIEWTKGDIFNESDDVMNDFMNYLKNKK